MQQTNVGKCGHAKCSGGDGKLCYQKGQGMRAYDDIKKELNAKARLEYLRTQINDECISTAEIIELQTLAEFIEPGDVQLLEWAGVPEFKENATKPTTLPCPLCGSDLHYKSNQQYWSCEDCPAILLEYVNRGDAHKVADHLDAN